MQLTILKHVDPCQSCEHNHSTKHIPTQLYASRFEKRGNLKQKLVIHLSSVHNSAPFKFHYALCLKSLTEYVFEKQVCESRAHTVSHLEKLAAKV